MIDMSKNSDMGIEKISVGLPRLFPGRARSGWVTALVEAIIEESFDFDGDGRLDVAIATVPTPDLGGAATTREFGDAVLAALEVRVP